MKKSLEHFLELVEGLKEQIHYAKRLELDRGDVLFSDEDPAQALFFIESGVISITKYTDAGHECILRLYKQGQFLGYRPFYTDKIHRGTAIVIEPGTFLRLPYKSFKMLLEDCHFVNFLIEDLSEKMLVTEKRFSEVLSKDVKAKIAETLVFLITHYPEHSWTKKEIAEFCGSTTATVIRTLSLFEKQGLIMREGKKLRVASLEKLLLSQGHLL